MKTLSVFNILRQITAIIKKTAFAFFVLFFLSFISPQKTYAVSTTPSSPFDAGSVFQINCDNANNFYSFYKADGTKNYINPGNDCPIQAELDQAGDYTVVETSSSGSSPDTLQQIEADPGFVGEHQITVSAAVTPAPTDTPVPTPTLTSTPTPTDNPTPTPTSTPTPTPAPASSTTTQVIYVTPTLSPTVNSTPYPSEVSVSDTPTPDQQVLGQATAPAALAPIAGNQDKTSSPGNSFLPFLSFAGIILLFLLLMFAIYVLFIRYRKRNKIFLGNTVEIKGKFQNNKENTETPFLEKKDYLIENPSIEQIKNAVEHGSIVTLGIASNSTNSARSFPDHWVVVKNFINGKLSINDPLFQSKKDVFLSERYANWNILKAKIYN